MPDIRLQRLAQVLISYSLNLQQGERLAIATEPAAAPLVREVVREALRAAANPEFMVDLPGVTEVLLREGSDEQLSYIPSGIRLALEEFETPLQILSADDPCARARDRPHAFHCRTQLYQQRWPAQFSGW